MPRPPRDEPRAQLAQALIIGGLAALIGTPIVYRVRAASAHAHATHTWWWPTWWLLVPLAAVVVGVFLVRAPDSHELRRRLLRSRLFERRHRP